MNEIPTQDIVSEGKTMIQVGQEDYIQARIDDTVGTDFALHDFLADAILGDGGRYTLDEYAFEHKIMAVLPGDRFLIEISWEEI